MRQRPPAGSLWRRFAGWASDDGNAGDSSAVQQRRVALYLKLLTLLIGAFYLLDAVFAVLERGPAALIGRGLVLHLAFVLSFAGAWLSIRGAERPPLLSRWLETLVTLVVALVAFAFLEYAPAPKSQIMAGSAFIVMLTLVVRAAIVPSSGFRTLAIGAVVTAIITYGYRPHGTATDQFGSFVLPWTLAFAVASAYVSRVIYGLERKVREASQLGQYVLESRLGEGGMGVVYRASHAMLRRPTAVKVLLPERTSPDSVQRFEREVRQTARLSHPNTVTIYDYGRTPDGLFYYAMELLDGADLDTVVGVGGPQEARRVVHVLSAVAGALAEAHARGLVHRDIKPANIMLCQQGGVSDVPKVLDFGLVRDLGGDATLTADRTLTGTPLYMSPESITTPDKVDGRSDLYALGAVGYFLLSGCHVFEGNTVLDVCTKHLLEQPVPPSERAAVEVPKQLEATILQCLAKEPAARPASASALQHRLLALDIDPWNASEAEAWWAAHRVALDERRSSTPPPASPLALAVDLSRRT